MGIADLVVHTELRHTAEVVGREEPFEKQLECLNQAWNHSHHHENTAVEAEHSRVGLMHRTVAHSAAGHKILLEVVPTGLADMRKGLVFGCCTAHRIENLCNLLVGIHCMQQWSDKVLGVQSTPVGRFDK